MTMEINKTAGTDGLTLDFYRYFLNAVSKKETLSIACR